MAVPSFLSPVMSPGCRAFSIGAFTVGLLCATASAGAEETVPRRFIQAIQDSAVAESSEIFDQLVAIHPDNAGLVRDGTGSDARVKVVTWMSESTYQRFWAAPETLPADKTTPDTWNVVFWVTTVPQVRDLCTRIEGDGEAVHTRLKQYLGLNPERQYARFAEIWVSPDDLKRPCPEPAVDVPACGLTMSEGVAADYRSWFNGNYAGSYNVNGAPWTRLGYTYDWAPDTDAVNPIKPVGASEFILRPGAPYTIAARYTTAEYCGRN